MKSLFRLINAAISGFIAKLIFEGIYKEYTTGLPIMDYEKTNINNKTTIEIINSLASLWNHALKQSLIVTGVSFLVIFIILEYIDIGKILSSVVNGSKRDLKEIRNIEQ